MYQPQTSCIFFINIPWINLKYLNYEEADLFIHHHNRSFLHPVFPFAKRKNGGDFSTLQPTFRRALPDKCIWGRPHPNWIPSVFGFIGWECVARVPYNDSPNSGSKNSRTVRPHPDRVEKSQQNLDKAGGPVLQHTRKRDDGKNFAKGTKSIWFT